MEMVEFFQLEIMCSWAAELLPLYGNSAPLKWTWGSLGHDGLVFSPSFNRITGGESDGRIACCLPLKKQN